MADPVDNQVLLKLVIRGMDPDEVRRLAQQTYGQLRVEAASHIDALTAYYRQAKQAETEAEKEAVQAKIKAETEALDAIQKLMRQQEVAANKARDSWHRVMEDLENITTVARGAWDIMSAGYERFLRLGETIAETTNVYSALKGSIDEMREASDGQIADIDLITAKNRAFEESLSLTEKQFGAVAAAADNFADGLRLNTKETLDKLINGLATGRNRILEMAGVTVNADEANRRYAASIGKTVEQLTDHDKKNAILQESLRKMDEKIVENGVQVRNFGDHWERAMAQIKNATDGVMLWVGKRIEDVVIGLTIGLPNAFRLAIAKIKDLLPGDEHYADHVRAQMGAELEAYEGGPASAKRVAEAAARLKDPNAYKGATTDFGGDHASRGKQTAYEPFGPEGENYAGGTGGGRVHRAEVDYEGLFAPQTGDQSLDDYVKGLEKANAAEEKHFLTMERIKGITVDAAVAYQKYADALGLDVDQLNQEERMQALSNEAQVQAIKLAEEAKKKADERRAELKSTQDKGGFLGVFLWGTDGPEQTYKEMDRFHQSLTDMTGDVSKTLQGAAQQWTDAMGKSVAASLFGAEGQKKSARQASHDVLEALSAQAAGKALWEGAEALGDLAIGNIAGAAAHGAAAAAYTGVAIATGLAGAAMGSGSSSSPAAGARGGVGGGVSGGVASSGSPNFGATGSRSTAANDNSGAPVTINVAVMPGGEAEAGRSVAKALAAYQAQTGQQMLVTAP